MTVFTITTYHDTTCAWCFVGHRTLEQAIQLYQKTYLGGKNDTFNYIFKPFYLRPDAPVEGIPLWDAMIEKNGLEMSEKILKRMRQVGGPLGIDFQLCDKARTGRTRVSHLLIQGAGRVGLGEGVQRRLVEAVYSMHFERGGDITSVEALVGVAEGVGIERAEAEGSMGDEGLGVEVDGMAERARGEEGVVGVPTYEINGKRLENSADVGSFFEALVEAKEAGEGG